MPSAFLKESVVAKSGLDRGRGGNCGYNRAARKSLQRHAGFESLKTQFTEIDVTRDKASAAKQRGSFNQAARGDGILGARHRHASRGRRKHLVTTTSTISGGTAVVSTSWSRAAAPSTSLTVAWCPVQRRKVLPMCPVRPVTYVSGRSSQYLVGPPRRFVPGDLAESARAPAPRRESARKRPSNTGQPASRRRSPFGAARAIIRPWATPGTPCRQRRAGIAR
jgi:hypothetical protein